MRLPFFFFKSGRLPYAKVLDGHVAGQPFRGITRDFRGHVRYHDGMELWEPTLFRYMIENESRIFFMPL